MSEENEFREKLENLINRHSKENGSNTPDFILADYLQDCLTVFDKAVKSREKWYGRDKLEICIEPNIVPHANISSIA